MNWFYVLLPIAGVHVWWPGLVILGLSVGIIGGFFGMGGAWMVTPALNVLGFPMAFAIGTDITHMAGKSLISTMRHAKFGNVDCKLSLIMVFGTIGGLEIGARNIMWLERIGKIDFYVRCGYLVLLTGIAWLVFADVMKRRNKDQRRPGGGPERGSTGDRHRVVQDLATNQNPACGQFSKGWDSLLGMAARGGRVRNRMAGRRTGYRRRVDPHAFADLSDRLPHTCGGRHRSF